jgi:hypothetical protein
MDDNRDRRQINWGSLIGWGIFILAIAGGPIIRLINQGLSGGIQLPTNILPILIGALVLLSILLPAFRAIGSGMRSRGDARLPTSPMTPRTQNTPMPPFGGGSPYRPSTSAQQTKTVSRGSQQLPPPPRFEPIISPTILTFGIIGLFLLLGIGMFLLF